MRAVEKYYSVAEVALLLSVSDKTVLRRLRDREFGDEVCNVGGDKRPEYRIPASGINAYLHRRKVFAADASELGVAARTVQELRRKLPPRGGV